MIDTVQALIWVEQEEFDKAEALMRNATQECLARNVPTMMATCTGILGSALAHNGKAAEAAVLLEKAFADRVVDAAGPYGPTFMRVALGVAYRNLGRMADAVRVARAAVEQAGEEYGHRTEALYELAETLRCAGDAAGADLCFAQAHEAAVRLGMSYYRKRAAAALAKEQQDRRTA